MGANPAAQRERAAVSYVTNSVYPNADSAEVVGMTKTASGTRVGVTAEMPGLLGGTKYATVTVDRNNRVVMQNKCSKGELYERIDRTDPAKRTKENLDDAVSMWETLNGFLVGGGERDDTSPPFRCESCGRTKYRYAGIISLWKKTGQGEYSCRNCGNIVRFGTDEQHVHEHG